MTTIACVKIGDKFGWEYVEKLWSMVDRHLSVPCSFLLITDDVAGAPIGEDVAVRHGTRVLHTDEPPHWAQLHLFQPGIVRDTTLYLDLDSVVVGSLDEMVARSEPLLAIRDINLPMFGSGIMKVEPEAAPEIWAYYEKWKSQPVSSRYAYPYKDQELMTKIAGSKFAPWPDEWVRSYRKDVRPHGRVPDGTRVVYFHGPSPKNHDVRDEPWMLEHWR